MVKRIISFLFLITPFFGLSQEFHPILSEFFGFQEGEHVSLNWTVKGGNTCQGIRIQRFNQQAFFDEIGEFDGVCGSTENEERYQFIDSFPLVNQTNSYRLEMGNQGFTSVIEVDFYDFNNSSYVLFGNPLESGSRIVYNNPTNELHYLEIYNSFGQKVGQFSSSSNEINISSDVLPSGILFFQLVSNGELKSNGTLFNG